MFEQSGETNRWLNDKLKISSNFYEKERPLKVTFHDTGNDTFISLVLLGLPLALQKTALGINPTNKRSLINQYLQRLQLRDKTVLRNNANRRLSTKNRLLQ